MEFRPLERDSKQVQALCRILHITSAPAAALIGAVLCTSERTVISTVLHSCPENNV
jgi:hypothetical protein